MSIIVLISLIGLLGVIFGFIIARIFDRPGSGKKDGSLTEKPDKKPDNESIR